MTELGQIFDPEREAPTGPRGRLTLEVLSEWLEQGATVELTMPRRVACAACDGGGCDGCSRSGAHKLEGDERTLRLTLPRTESERVLVRLVEPLGAEAGLAELTVEIRVASAPSHDARRIETAIVHRASAPLELRTLVVTLVILIAIAIAVSAARR
jgi:hypothetical protein